jgi:hypothetical protein
MKFFALLALALVATASASGPWIGLAAYGQADCLAKLTNTRIFTNGCHKNLVALGGGSYKADTTATPPTLKSYTSSDCSGTAAATLSGDAAEPTVKFGTCVAGTMIKTVTAVTAAAYTKPVFINAATESGNVGDTSVNCGGTPTYVMLKFLGMCYWDAVASQYYEITCSGTTCTLQPYNGIDVATGKCNGGTTGTAATKTYPESLSLAAGTGSGDGKCIVAQKGTKDGNPMPAATEAYIYKPSNVKPGTATTSASTASTNGVGAGLTFTVLCLAVTALRQ